MGIALIVACAPKPDESAQFVNAICNQQSSCCFASGKSPSIDSCQFLYGLLQAGATYDPGAGKDCLVCAARAPFSTRRPA